MKVGEYVRFKTLSREIKIGKVIEIIEPDKESMEKYCVYDLDNNEVTVDDYVIKSSPNIIDLIEVGDYVNGERVTPLMIRMRDEQGVFGLPDNCEIYIDEIKVKSIVTKESFERMEYRIGE